MATYRDFYPSFVDRRVGAETSDALNPSIERRVVMKLNLYIGDGEIWDAI